MKTTKLFFMAALALMTAACSNDNNEFAQQPQKAEGITITAQLAPKTSVANTRALTDKSTYIEAKWAVNEHIAILYEVNSTNYMADATITAVDGSGTATISFTVEAGTPDDTDCTLVYPLSAAKDDHTGWKDAATLLGAQDGTLNANLDYRIGDGTIQTTTPGLTVIDEPIQQFSIYKFTIKNADGSANISVKSLTITIGDQDYVITPASATSTLYAALPGFWTCQPVLFTAKGSDSKTYKAAKPGATLPSGKFYQSIVPMAPTLIISPAVGQVIGDDGKNYASASLPTGVNAVARICYVNGDNGLALALADESGNLSWDDAKTACFNKNTSTPVTGANWILPTKNQWDAMISVAGGYENLRDDNNLQSGYYPSSTATPWSDDYCYYFNFYNGNWTTGEMNTLTRACLAF